LTLSAEFKKILDDPAATERDAQRFLKSFPMLMVRLFNVSWNYYLAVPEFSLGTDFRADFLILSADSCCWHTVFVELEGRRTPITGQLLGLNKVWLDGLSGPRDPSQVSRGR